jgi:hypothetical protein
MPTDPEADKCTREKPNPNTKFGHWEASFFPNQTWRPESESSKSGDVVLNQCVYCTRISDHQPSDRAKQLAKLRRLLKVVPPAIMLVALAFVHAFLGLGAFLLPFLGLGVRDKEMQFLTIDATSVADTVVGESSVDLDTIGVNFASRMGIRIFKVEVCPSALTGTERWLNIAASDAWVNLALRTITSGGVMPDMNDDGVITYGQAQGDFVTAAGIMQIFAPKMYGEVFPEGLLVCSDRLYTVLENNSNGALVLDWRIWYKLEKLSDSDYREMWEIWRRA